MEAEQVITKILADAKAEADKITRQANENEAAEKARLDKDLGEYRSQTEALAKKAAKDEESHILAAARMRIAKELLAEKRRILDEVFEQALKRIHESSDPDYKSLMTKLMLQAVETGDEEVVIDRNETRIDMELIKEANRKLGPGFKGNLRLARDRDDLSAGFLLRRGKIKTNVSLPVLIQQARKDLEIELAQTLFAG